MNTLSVRHTMNFIYFSAGCINWDTFGYARRGKNHSHSMVKGFEFALSVFGFPLMRPVYTNCDTSRARLLDSWILYSDPSSHERVRIINERREKVGKKIVSLSVV